MEIAVIGSGAIGGVLGAYMKRAGENVIFCDIAKEHVAVMREKGLIIEGDAETFTVEVSAFTPEELLHRGKTLDIVFICVKAQHTEKAVLQILPLLTEHSFVVSFQNGLCEEIIAPMIGKQRTVGCFVNFSADYLVPGRILYGGVSALYLGELDGEITPRVKDLQQRLKGWGPAQITNNLLGYLWGKLSYAAVLFATALVDETMATVVSHKNYRPMLIELASEVLEVADALAITPEGFDDWYPNLIYSREQRNETLLTHQLDKLADRMAKNKKTKSGIWRDLAVRKRETEVDFQLLPVIKTGRKYGYELPLTSKLVQMIKELEKGTRRMEWANLNELKLLHESLSNKR